LDERFGWSDEGEFLRQAQNSREVSAGVCGRHFQPILLVET
jgi:hypothetical protein